MRSAAVREAWEFYRDNCPGFKEPMRKEFRRLDEHVASLESENAKLRELLAETLMDYRQYAEKYGLPPYLSDVNEHLDARLRELGIEVGA